MNFLKKLILLLFLCGTYGFAQELVYAPINPSFAGGHYLNGSWLLNQAQAQNNISESASSRTSFSQNQLNDFTSSLNRSILSQLSKKIIDDSFGEEGMSEGIYEFGDFSVEVSNTTEGIQIYVQDALTGNETEITIPYF